MEMHAWWSRQPTGLPPRWHFCVRARHSSPRWGRRRDGRQLRDSGDRQPGPALAVVPAVADGVRRPPRPWPRGRRRRGVPDSRTARRRPAPVTGSWSSTSPRAPTARSRSRPTSERGGAGGTTVPIGGASGRGGHHGRMLRRHFFPPEQRSPTRTCRSRWMRARSPRNRRPGPVERGRSRSTTWAPCPAPAGASSWTVAVHVDQGATSAISSQNYVVDGSGHWGERRRAPLRGGRPGPAQREGFFDAARISHGHARPPGHPITI